MSEDKVLDLSSGAELMAFRIDSHDFSVEIFEAVDLIAENDLLFWHEPDSCLKCAHSFKIPEEQAQTGDYKCPECGAGPTEVLPSQKFLDGLAGVIKERYGVPRCGRTEAAAFYTAILSATKAKKKESMTPPESPTTTEELTPGDGAQQPGGLG